RSIAGRTLCDACSIAVLREIRGTALHAGGAIASHRAVGGRLASVRAFGEAARCLIVVAGTGATAIVVVGIATICARTALTDRSSMRIGGACLALQATGVGIVVGRACIAALVIARSAGEGTG